MNSPRIVPGEFFSGRQGLISVPSISDNLAVLVGNGLSIAANPELSLENITTEVLRRFEDGESTKVVDAMRELAARTLPDGVKSGDDFEILVGALGFESRTLEKIENLAVSQGRLDQDLRKSFADVSQFLVQLRDSGISHVLEVIFERSQLDQSANNSLCSLLFSIVNCTSGRVYFANLNYDIILLSSLLSFCSGELEDLASGRPSDKIEVSVNNDSFCAYQLRRGPEDFLGRRVQLLHLHGSLTFWKFRRNSGGEESAEWLYFKLTKELLNRYNLWREVRAGAFDPRPVVVLASRNDKTDEVDSFPFKVAYDMFGSSLSSSTRWLIIGYSFRDLPVNEMLRSEFMNRYPKPKVLVVTYGDDLDEDTVERALGWGKEDGPSKNWLNVYRHGAFGVEDSEDWEAFLL